MPQHYKLLDGFAWNPLAKYPRNEDCFCKSHKKFKHCCLPKIQPVVELDDYERIQDLLARNAKIVLVDGDEANSNKVSDEES